MIFQKAKNLDTAFRQVRAFTMVIILASFISSGFVALKSYQIVSAAESRIYILANGKALEAFAGSRIENIPVEARDHVETFHQSFFTLDPDEKVIRTNITKALYLADGSAQRVYESLKENNYYTGIIAGNVSQQIMVDSVNIKTDAYPYYFLCFATQRITRPSSITSRSLVTEGYLRNVSRSDNNPHGFLIERWNTIENKDMKIQNR